MSDNNNSHSETEADIAICGAGPVGLSLAALLVKRGIPAARIALIDAKTVEQARQDPRSLALSYGSSQILQEIGAWPLAATAIHQIHVSRRGHFGRTLIQRDEFQLPALGYVTRYGTLVTALAALPSLSGVQLLRPLQVTASTEHEDNVELQLSDGRALHTRLLVQAEGGLFGAQGAKALQRDYQQVGIVAHVQASAPIAQRAFERFTDQGPLALLPQDDGHGNNYALVWCVRPDTASNLLALDDTAFLQALMQAFGGRLGRFTKTTARNSFPLGLNARPASSARIVAIGNAAQTLHPVAGQGLNLGLRDATVLARMLAAELSSATLLQFAAARQADRSVTIHLTDVMARIFASAPDGAWSQTLLGLSLGLVDVIKPARRLLAQQMMFGRR
ncbi:UbiH/UbiF/VisC/COQ6 family ubiquinone biosynthesis hydroxylase [Collimonas pratensis]|uniref:Ubiquinone biosynthesis hydroxylase, UbiH/UbiF/VisC/COQ6 family protein n=1 Tax=Collimonas pratensis TaxID=279113 RepID=A0A127QAV1_9BURK|nr:UbiH/UbiF/VisC/COQ6 family ubiquinone biosynthesis hydroxylase [Collimonas pratensis]AMP06752.1 ubiquinone biosynthesis hydroxylase, UbiH/UbiF/VisC/COQ6 family protein [Collimonas pratensis]